MFKSKQTTSFGPGFGSPLRTPIKKWRQANRINYLRSTASTSDILKELAESNAREEAKKKRRIQSSHRRRIAVPSGEEDSSTKKELTAQQLIRRLPRYYDPKKDPAMRPKTVRGGGFAPLSSLNARQKKLLELARIRARQPRARRGGKDSNKGTRNSPSGNEKKECEVKAGEEKKANSSSPSAEKGQKEGNEVLKNVKEETVLDEAADVDNNNGGGGSDDNNDSDQESDDEYSAGV